MSERSVFQDYWRAYGGVQALRRSPYLGVSILVTLALTPVWLQPGWWELVQSSVPSLLGFSLAGMAMILAFGNSEFLSILAVAGTKKKGQTDSGACEFCTACGKCGRCGQAGNPKVCPSRVGTSALMALSASFMHFMLVQILAFVLSLAAGGYALIVVTPPTPEIGILLLLIQKAFWFFGFLIFVYAWAAVIATIAAIFRMIRQLNVLLVIQAEDAEEAKPRD